MEGRGTYRFFEATMGAQVRDRRLMEHELRHAIDRRELSLVYQPQTNIKSGEIVGFEALLRWSHPTRGEISPGTFIPIAEESGMILQIGEWVLRTACREAASWAQPLEYGRQCLGRAASQRRFCRNWCTIFCFQTGLSPQRLELEITETALIRDLIRALSTLRQAESIGCPHCHG